MLTFIQHSCNSGSVSECIRKSWRSQFSKEPTAEDEAHDEHGGAGTPGFLTLQRFGWVTLLLHQPPGRFIARAGPNSPQLYSDYTALIYIGCALRGGVGLGGLQGPPTAPVYPSKFTSTFTAAF